MLLCFQLAGPESHASSRWKGGGALLLAGGEKKGWGAPCAAQAEALHSWETQSKPPSPGKSTATLCAGMTQ